jgi:hypothetical protein
MLVTDDFASQTHNVQFKRRRRRLLAIFCYTCRPNLSDIFQRSSLYTFQFYQNLLAKKIEVIALNEAQYFVRNSPKKLTVSSSKYLKPNQVG